MLFRDHMHPQPVSLFLPLLIRIMAQTGISASFLRNTPLSLTVCLEPGATTKIRIRIRPFSRMDYSQSSSTSSPSLESESEFAFPRTKLNWLGFRVFTNCAVILSPSLLQLLSRTRAPPTHICVQ
ncbi:hypothetical protein B0H11DRAFT_566498 [Mycena galericulata]|nr:hypothetical protein B0H11DRAFT_566498 [Mycena galericulata]